ncbi:MAG: class I SAM-dependent methyltransferase [Bacteroidales bacterium]|nr:class I SAM-dependent methyltransferase [Bacteroidales bacterium]
MKNEKIYPDSGVELKPFMSRYYDSVMNIASFGFYKSFIRKAIKNSEIQENDSILDLGCGTGRNASLMLKYVGSNGSLKGLDISKNMEKQFHSKFKNDKRAEFINQRIDIQFDLGQKFDLVFISFVIHGFPHEIRKIVIENAYRHLKPNGRFIILDFAEFNMKKMPLLHKWIFKAIECKYAFEYITHDWKSILSEKGFQKFSESFYMKKYVRLLVATK